MRPHPYLSTGRSTNPCKASSVLTDGFDAATCQRPATHLLTWNDRHTGVPCSVEACRSCADSFRVHFPQMQAVPLEEAAA